MPDKTITLYRIGQFYEAFDENARVLNTIFGTTMVPHKDKNDKNRYMAGFIAWSLEDFRIKLESEGYTIVYKNDYPDFHRLYNA